MTIETRPIEERDTYGQAFLQTGNLWREDPIVEQFVFSRRFAATAAELLGVEGVRLYHDQALIKEAHGGATPWHQDQFYWPLPAGQTVTMWMPLVDVPEEVGSMTFGSGTHALGPLCELSISDESEVALQQYVDEFRRHARHPWRAPSGRRHVPRRLDPAPRRVRTRPTTARPVMTVIYVADGAVVQKPTNPFQEFDRLVWLGDRPPGESVDSEMNPVLYRR